jgi:tetratricopeptide (TPR) repeat protein
MTDPPVDSDLLQDRKNPLAGDPPAKDPLDDDPADEDPAESESGLAEGFLAGERIAVTGTFASMTHEEAARLVHEHGGAFAHAVSRNTTILVIGEEGWPLEADGAPSLKFQTAQELNRGGARIRFLTESEWLAALGLTERSRQVHRSYTPAMLSQMLHVPVGTVRRWERLGLIEPSRRVKRLSYFDFQEVTRLRKLTELLRDGVPRERLELSLEALRKCLPNVTGLDRLDLLAQDARLVYRDGRGLVEAVSGQRLLGFADAEADDPGDALRDGAEEEPAVLPLVLERTGPIQPVEAEPQSGPSWLERGRAFLDADDVEAAIEAFRMALMEDSREAESHFHLADALYRRGDRAAALERFYACVEVAPDYLEAWTQIGCLHGEQRHYEEAVTALRIALAIHPDFPDAHLHLAEALAALGRFEEARPHWTAYLDFDDVGPWAELARERLAEIGGTNGSL